MEKWKEFELDCTNYLNKNYGKFFYHLGFSDSTVSDIKYCNGNKEFYIEAKMPYAQSGQFVLLPDFQNKKFIFSPKNKSTKNTYTDLIIRYMNKDFDKYMNAGTAGKDVLINQNLLSDWVISSYRKKGVKFFITKDNGYIIFPIEKFGEYFKITAKYRIKKSGSSKVSKSRQADVIDIINSMNIIFELLDDFNIASNMLLDKKRFKVLDSDYMFSYLKDNIYRIRKLSNTRNANVIFSIKLLKNQDARDLNNFINSL